MRFIYGLILVIEILGVWSMGEIHQNQAYHHFADQRDILGIAHFCDVISNIPFVIIGLMGLFYLLKENRWKNLSGGVSWIVVFLGVFLVGPGSAYYHLEPNDARLVWDRLPMTISFMALMSTLFSYKISRQRELVMLMAFLAIGFFSLFYWVKFDDLRIYFLVQLTPIIFVPLVAFTQKRFIGVRKYLVAAFLFYAGAKVTEKKDLEIFDLLGVSGHTIKHLLAAGAVSCFYFMCRKLGRKL